MTTSLSAADLLGRKSGLYWYIVAATSATIFAISLALPFHTPKVALWTVVGTLVANLIYLYTVTKSTSAHESQPTNRPGVTILEDAIVDVPDELLNRLKSAMTKDDSIVLATRRHPFHFRIMIGLTLAAAASMAGIVIAIITLGKMPTLPINVVAALCILYPVATSASIVIAKVRWNGWCLVVTDTYVSICIFYPPELPWMTDYSSSMALQMIGVVKTSVGPLGKFMGGFGHLTLDSQSDDDREFKKMPGIPGVKKVAALVNAQIIRMKAAG